MISKEKIPESERKVHQLFTEKFFGQPLLFKSPGRINIIGEHTDYNEGYVMPAAIDKAIFVAIQKRNDNLVQLYSGEFNEAYETELNQLHSSAKRWPNYILGVVQQYLQRGSPITGFSMVVDGDVPIGAGLSSSAAVECAVAFALNELFQLKYTKMEMVLLAQKAEHEFAGVMCGVMDQFASMFGKKEQVIQLDCRSLQYQYAPLKLEGYQLVLFNSNIKHSLASSAYNERRQQCLQGVEWVRQHLPEVNSLRDIDMPMLNKFVLQKNKLIYTRCKYVVEENERVLNAVTDLNEGNLVALGQKMYATHDGLSNMYEVSCKELDLLVTLVKNEPGVLGARMMGGGFGGCTLNLVAKSKIEKIVNEVSEKYRLQAGIDCTTYLVSVEDGTRKL